MEKTVLFFHLVAALVFVAGIVVAGVAFAAARRRENPAEIALLLGVSRVGALLVAVGALAVLGFGLWLVHLGGYSLSASWIRGALILYAIALTLGAYGGQHPKQARQLATELAAGNSVTTPRLRGLLLHRQSRLANYGAALAVLAILALMVFKP
jgi:uncharacterized membrane protein